MSYCHKCGKKSEEEDSFCENCGTKIKEIIEDIKEGVENIEEEVEEAVRKTSYGGLIRFLIFIAIVGYIVLNFWAMGQLTPVISAGSVWASISNSDADMRLSQTSLKSSIRIENPTFVPIVFGRIAYDANYGDNKIAEGKTSFFIMAPYSQKDVSIDLTVYHLSTLKSVGEGLVNLFAGNSERKYVDIYVDIGIAKFKIKTVE